ncbi:FabD/lysophospholipase-like protein [Aspergillus niger CBS 101883]|uniref:FabD/lysophospholipase-like protein n=1 Tax=Aspergillus lacticoffeatus (strain CBS 101883) TaxID=1450533 RepID=UPI000D7F4BD9|nr:FabD/lysophospholipase-like protein [Aspergillus niger CBS 101883]PYH57632.1 FabD/lysophospholipase-like protein [Aspergillus niger CBS 101883]
MQSSPRVKYNLLSFDGGGMRGYGSMLILERLMSYVKDIEGDANCLADLLKDVPDANCQFAESSFHPHDCPAGIEGSVMNEEVNKFLPCHYFDCIIGTSTGGLIAMMLGRLRMTVTHARQQYQLLGQQVFGSPRSFPYLSFRPLAIIKYNHEGLVKAVKDIIKRHDSIQQGPYGFPNASFNKTDYGVSLGKVYDSQWSPIRTNENEEMNEVNYRFQTYDTPEKTNSGDPNLGTAFTGPLWWVARACTAAPTYFIPKEIEALNGNIWRFKDAGLVLQNPTQEGVDEVLRWGPPSETYAQCFNTIVSIGAGLQRPPKNFGPGRAPGGGWLDTLAVIKAGFNFDNPEAVHKNMSRTLGVNGIYWRFNSDSHEWGNIKLDQYDEGTMTKMRTLANTYLAREDVKHDLQECAKSLVKHRRQRLKQQDAWERFALAVEYRCAAPGCFNHYNLKEDMENHMRRCHRGNQEKAKRLIWRYDRS